VFEVVDISQKQQLILSLPWLRRHNPAVDWSSRNINFDKCPPNHHLTCAGVAELGEEQIQVLNVQSSGFFALKLVQKKVATEGRDQGRTTTSLEDMHEFVPEKYWYFEDVFAKSIFNSLPVHTSYNHQINLDELFISHCSNLCP
jgi:hypothetical protein